MVNVLIVDDSSFVRRTLQSMLEQDREIKVIGAATNGQEALDMIDSLDPDIVTLDVEMPRMDGLTALKRIMQDKPCPVIMVSSLTTEGAETALKALELGALDYFAKPSAGSIDTEGIRKDLCAKVKELAKRKSLMRLIHSRAQRQAEAGKTPSSATTATRPVLGSTFSRPAAAPASPAARPLLSRPALSSPVTPAATGTTLSTASATQGEIRFARPPFDLLCIGVSTGGPPAVQKVLSAFPRNFPVPILVAQHMPLAFTGPFAARLNSQCEIEVVEAVEPTKLKSGTAYICRGGMHLRAEMRQGTLFAVVSQEPKEALYKPSANELMESAGLASGRRSLCVMLTGMGSDGLEGAKVLKEKGGYIIAQSERTCVVYGMPKAVVDAGITDDIVDIDDMAATILALFTK